MQRARPWFGLLAILTYTSLETGLLLGLYRPEYRAALDIWIIYPSALLVAVTMMLASMKESRKHLAQPAIALLVIVVLSGLQEASTSLNVPVLIGHVGAIVWLVSGFMNYVQSIPPSHNNRSWLVKIAGLSLALLELPFLIYIVRGSAPVLESNASNILGTLVVTTIMFGLVLSYIVWINLRGFRLLTTTQGS